MNRTKQLTLVITIAIAFSSCVVRVPKYIQQNFTFCYDGQNTGIDSLINIEGYYVVKYPYKGVDTACNTCTNLMFYKDGTLLSNFRAFDEEGVSLSQFTIPSFFKEVAQNEEGKKAFWFYNSSYWGCYKIEKGIIKVQYINRVVGPIVPWIASEEWYKVIDRNTIIQIETKPLDIKPHQYTTDNDWKNWEIDKKKLKYYPAHFVPVAIRPAPDCWLKKEKWFWCKNRK